MEYKDIVNIIRARTHCSVDEAWTGLSIAFLNLDRSRTEVEQFAYLIRYGALAVIDEWRCHYTDATSGILRMVPSDYSTFGAVPSLDVDCTEIFPEDCRGYAEYLANGGTYSIHTANHYLRKHGGINDRRTARRLYERTRLHAKRLLELARVLSCQAPST